ncbi:MAG: helix-hairpin-helix domain-containing protein [Candidatus Thermoplasmatota archaeon]
MIETFQGIKGVGPALAEELYANGFYSIEDINEASRSELLEIDGIGKAFSKTIKDNLD